MKSREGGSRGAWGALVAAVAAVAVVSACQQRTPGAERSAPAASAPAAKAPAAKAPAAKAPAAGAGDEAVAAAGGSPAGAAPGASGRPRVVFLGTSLTAGLGVDPDSAYPAVVGRKADSAGTPITVVNAGVSGETSAGALRRVDWVLADPADVIVVETGANDGLRGQNTDSLRANLERIVGRARALHPQARIAVVQMEAPPNFGAAYTRRFHDVYPAVARSTGAVLFPFLLDGVAGVPALNQADGIHPNEEGARRVGGTVWRALAPLVAGRRVATNAP